MEEIYWITRLDAISAVATLCMIIGLAGTILAVICTLVGLTDDVEETPRIEGRFLAKIFPAVLAIGIIIRVFVPTTKEALVIYAVGGGLDYLRADSTAQQLPKKVIDACDAYLDELLKEK